MSWCSSRLVASIWPASCSASACTCGAGGWNRPSLRASLPRARSACRLPRQGLPSTPSVPAIPGGWTARWARSPCGRAARGAAAASRSAPGGRERQCLGVRPHSLEIVSRSSRDRLEADGTASPGPPPQPDPGRRSGSSGVGAPWALRQARGRSDGGHWIGSRGQAPLPASCGASSLSAWTAFRPSSWISVCW